MLCKSIKKYFKKFHVGEAQEPKPAVFWGAGQLAEVALSENSDLTFLHVYASIICCYVGFEKF